MQLSVNEIDKEGVGEEDCQRVVRVVRVEIRAAGEDIRSSKEVAWDMDDLQIEVCKVEQPSCLATVKVLGLMEVHQVLVVGEGLYRERRAMEIEIGRAHV